MLGDLSLIFSKTVGELFFFQEQHWRTSQETVLPSLPVTLASCRNVWICQTLWERRECSGRHKSRCNYDVMKRLHTVGYGYKLKQIVFLNLDCRWRESGAWQPHRLHLQEKDGMLWEIFFPQWHPGTPRENKNTQILAVVFFKLHSLMREFIWNKCPKILHLLTNCGDILCPVQEAIFSENLRVPLRVVPCWKEVDPLALHHSWGQSPPGFCGQTATGFASHTFRRDFLPLELTNCTLIHSDVALLRPVGWVSSVKAKSNVCTS